jgi:ribosome-binding ATPase
VSEEVVEAPSDCPVKLGIVGFPQSGKSTLFALLTESEAAVTKKAARGELRAGVARVPDERLTRLAACFAPRRAVLATVDVVELGGLERGRRASLDVADLRSSDALLHVIRAFPSPALGPADPAGEVAALETELLLADLEVVERRLDKLGPGLHRKATEAEERERVVLARVKGPLEEGVPLRAHGLSADEARLLRGFQFLSQKPTLHCLNLAEADIARRDALMATLPEAAKQPDTLVGWVSAALEREVAALAPDEQRAFLAPLGLPEPALHRIVRDAYTLLGLASFFTVGEHEVRAWTIRAGASALEAAGIVHSDMARGFIRAEVIGWAELLAAGSLAEARRQGTLRLEGKEYRIKDGDVCHFRFNVGR